MEQKIVLFSSGDGGQNERATRLLGRLRDVKIEVVGDTKVLDGRVLLPFIETADGYRYYGLESIDKFVENQLSGMLVNHNRH